MRKAIALVVVLAIVVIGGYFIFRAYRAQQQNAAIGNLQTVTAGRGNLTATVGATGAVRANQTALLAWNTTGIVEAVDVEVGDSVEAGSPLAVLMEKSLPQNVILAKADLSSAQTALNNLQQSEVAKTQALQALSSARVSLLEAESAMVRFDEQPYKDDIDRAREDQVDAQDRLERAQEDFEPYESWDEDNPTRRTYKDRLDEAQRNYDETVRNLELLQLEKETAQANYDFSIAQLADSEREYDRLRNGADPDEVASLETRIAAAEATLSLAQLAAPFAGTVTEVNVKPGDQAIPEEVAFRIDDLSRLLLDVQVSEVDINRITRDQPVIVTFDAIQGKEYTGRVSWVSQVGISTQGIIEFVITVELEEPDELVKPGMTAAVNVVVNRLDNVLQVPKRAVRTFEGELVVYVMRNGSLERVPVTLGSSSDTMSEVVNGGLQTGDAIVLNPPQTLDLGGPPPFVRR